VSILGHEKEELKEKIGENLGLRSIIAKIVSDKENWNSFSKFCTIVMSGKKNEERKRQREEVENIIVVSPSSRG
jgi:hypothetical protein